MIHPSFAKLGRNVKDVITGIEGVCDSICFDLYGCVMASVRLPGVTSDKGEPKLAHWFDVKRLVITDDGKPVLDLPDFSKPEAGAADKAPR